MSGKRYCNPAMDLNKFDKRLSRCKEGVDQTCPVQRPDMSGKCYCNSTTDPNKSGKRLSRCEERVDRTCPVQEPDMSGKLYWNPAMDQDKFGGLRNLEGLEHVWAGGWTCPILLTEIRLGNWLYPDFLVSWSVRSFLMICTSPTHLTHPP
jgi:hypothetical protein